MGVAPPPHEGPCKRCGSDNDVTKLGRYRGLCPDCRLLSAAESRAKREAQPFRERAAAPRPRERDIIEEELHPGAKQPSLTKVCQQLTERAGRFEEAVAQRKQASVEVTACLIEFRDALRVVARVAQTMANQNGARTGTPA